MATLQSFDSKELNEITVRARPYTNRRFRSIQGILQASGQILVESDLKEKALSLGFLVDDDRDNKSAYEPEYLYAALMKYATPRSLQADEAVLRDAIGLAYRQFGRRPDQEKLSPLPLDTGLSSGLKLDHSSGAPYFRKKGEVFTQDLALAQRIERGLKCPEPCVAYHRTQHGKEGPKTRLIWGYPQSMTLLEGRFAIPALERYRSNRTVMAFAMHRHEIAARMIPITNSGVRVSVDYSGFDSTLHSRLIHTAFAILETHFSLSDEEHKVWSEVIIRYFLHTPIVMPDGMVYTKHHGVPSGSFFTQLIDSICNYIVLQYVAMRISRKPILDDKILVLGDDALWGWDLFTTTHQISSFAKELGVVINFTKSLVTRFGESVTFLGHDWIKGIVDRNVLDVVKRMVYPERRSSIRDRRLRVTTRAIAYAGDSEVAHSVILDMLNFKSNNVLAMYLQGVGREAVTGHQQYLELIDRGERVPGDSLKLGYVALLL